MMFPSPIDVPTRLHTAMPAHFQVSAADAQRSMMGNAPPNGSHFHSLLEGPAFDVSGQLYCVDVPYGRIFRISPDGDWDVFAAYDGRPTGLKIAPNGEIIVADHHYGIVAFDSSDGSRRSLATHFEGEPLLGVNDIVLGQSGNLYFTDPGMSGLENPCGRVFRLRPDGTIDLLMSGLAYPNGLAVNAAETILYVAVTRTLQLVRLPLAPDYGPVVKAGVFVQLDGGSIGPNGMAVDSRGNVAVAQTGRGLVWLYSPFGELLARVGSCAGRAVTNLTYGGPGKKQLYITEAETASILVADMPFPG